MNNIKAFFLVLIVFFCAAYLNSALAANQNDVLVNEIAWMGTNVSFNDEWIELFNNTSNSINLDGWVLKSADEKLKINLGGQISANGFYLLERTDDTSLPQITADLIYKGALNNGGESLTLYDNLGGLIDQASYPAKWPAGNNTTKQTMERNDLSSWQTSQNPGGTPKAKNSPGIKTVNKTIDKPLPQNEKSDSKVNVLQASASEPIDLHKNTDSEKSKLNPWLLFLITISVIISGTIVFVILKYKNL